MAGIRGRRRTRREARLNRGLASNFLDEIDHLFIYYSEHSIPYGIFCRKICMAELIGRQRSLCCRISKNK